MAHVNVARIDTPPVLDPRESLARAIEELKAARERRDALSAAVDRLRSEIGELRSSVKIAQEGIERSKATSPQHRRLRRQRVRRRRAPISSSSRALLASTLATSWMRVKALWRSSEPSRRDMDTHCARVDAKVDRAINAVMEPIAARLLHDARNAEAVIGRYRDLLLPLLLEQPTTIGDPHVNTRQAPLAELRERIMDFCNAHRIVADATAPNFFASWRQALRSDPRALPPAELTADVE